MSVKPKIEAEELCGRAEAALGRRIADWHASPHGADHLGLFASLADGRQVVIKAGLEAHVDARVLQLLADLPVNVPTLHALW